MTIEHVQAMIDAPDPVVADGLAPVIHGKFTFSAAGMVVDGTPTYEEWAEVGGVLAVMDRGIQFLVGDWIVFGEAAYGELAAQAIDARSWRPETVRAYTWLAKQVPPANRMLDRGLSISHHIAVAKLPPKEQRTWLRRALSDGDPWPVARLQAAVKSGGDTEPTLFYVLVSFATKEKRDAFQKQQELAGLTCKAVDKRGTA